MMTEEDLTGLAWASKAAYSADLNTTGDRAVGGGYEAVKTFEDPGTGFQAKIYKNDQNEYIVAFAGTKPTQSADIFTDINLGWTQWSNNRTDNGEAVLAYVRSLQGADAPSAIHFTGESLGGAHAQYATYRYAELQSQAPAPGVPVSLATFNALGGQEGLQKYNPGGFDPSLMQGTETYHFVVKGDVVHTYGSGHVGGNVRMIDYGTLHPHPWLNAISAHPLSNADTFLSGQPLLQISTPHSVEYQNTSDLQTLAASFSNFLNDGDYAGAEGVLRTIAAVNIAFAYGRATNLNANLSDILGHTFTAVAALGGAAVLDLFDDALQETITRHADDIEWLTDKYKEATQLRNDIYDYVRATAPDLIEAAADGLRETIARASDGIDQLAQTFDQAIDWTSERADAFYDDVRLWTAGRYEDLARLAGASAEGAALIREKLLEAGDALADAGLGATKTFIHNLLDALQGLAGGGLFPYPLSLIAGGELLAPWFGLSDVAAAGFNAGQAFAPRRDPLTFDLDGDGLETLGAVQSGVFFDHDGDGIRTGSGWISSDDGLLVLDRNGNGTVDSGRELFGDATPLAAGGLAADGFAALAQEDTNADGRVDSADQRWFDLRMWRDLNQDGASQASELFTLDAVGIGSINLGSTDHSQVLANGNRIADLGSYTRTDGQFGELGAVGLAGDVDLGEDTFNRVFTDRVPITADVLLLPSVLGAGKVRDLREAATLSPGLKEALVQYTAADARSTQVEALDDVLLKWAESADLPSMYERAAAAVTTLSPNGFVFAWAAIGNESASNSAEWQALVQHWDERLRVTEAFNGRPFFALPGDGGGTQLGLSIGNGGDGQPGTVSLALNSEHMAHLEQSYQSLKESLYGALTLQARLKPTLDAFDVRFDSGGQFVIDTSRAESALQARVDQDPVSGIGDLVDFARYSGFQTVAARLLESNVRSLPATPQLIDAYAALGIRVEGTPGFSSIGTESSDIVFLGAADNVVNGARGDDMLFGGAGADELRGGDDDDVLSGGAGNDVLEGGPGNDVYRFGRGDGQDRIESYDPSSVEAIEFAADVAAADVVASNDGQNLTLSIRGTAESIRVDSYFNGGPPNTGHRVEEIRFADGTVWDVDAVQGKTLEGTDAAETLQGFDGRNDVITGRGGNDRILGRAGDDVIGGGEDHDFVTAGEGHDSVGGDAGDDILAGEAGNDTVSGGAGDDRVFGDEGDDVLSGDAGNDLLNGGSGNDVYRFGRGDGQDLVEAFDPTRGTVDAIQFAADIAPSDVVAANDGRNLTLRIRGITDTIAVENYFNGGAPHLDHLVEEIRFADGTVWDVDAVQGKTLEGTDAAETLQGFDGRNDVITGRGGNDRILGRTGNDVIDGGDDHDFVTAGEGNDSVEGRAGDDILAGEAGNDMVAGGAGDDRVFGNEGDDVLSGDAGNDVLDGNSGNDVYRFGRGDGQDLVDAHDPTRGTVDAIEFTAGIASSDVVALNENQTLRLSIRGTTDSIVVNNYFNGGAPHLDHLVEEIRFADGTAWDVDAVQGKTLEGTDAAETLQGFDGRNDVITGRGGNDRILGRSGNDVIDGGDDHDYVTAGEGNDSVEGDAGDDILSGEAGNDTVSGGAGNDTVFGDEDDDVLSGDAGNDLLNGGAGNDVYRFGRGDGQDLVDAHDPTRGTVDAIVFTAGIASGDVVALNENQTLRLSIRGTTDSIVVNNYFNGGAPHLDHLVEEIRFADGTVWDVDAVQGKTLEGTDAAETLQGFDGRNDMITGRGGNDRILGRAGNDVIHGGDDHDFVTAGEGNDSVEGDAGDDILAGEAGNDVVRGGAGNDTVFGDEDDDVLSGDAGNDLLNGGSGNDVYRFGRGDGQDLVDAFDPTRGTVDAIVFAADIAASDVVASKDGQNLMLSIAGTIDSIAVNNYFHGGSPHVDHLVEEIRFADGTVWDVSTVLRKTSPNAAPDAADDTASVLEDRIVSGNVIAGSSSGAGRDTDVDTNVLQVSAVNGSAAQVGAAIMGTYGTLVLQSNGTYSYAADADILDVLPVGAYPILDTFSYTINDGNDGSDTATLTISVAITNDAQTINGTNKDDLLAGDQVSVGSEDTIYGANGSDLLLGRDGADALFGGNGDDLLLGGQSRDVLRGDNGNDSLVGEAGDDVLYGGNGNDLLTGGRGADIFVMEKSGGADVVTDFAVGEDRLRLEDLLTIKSVKYLKVDPNATLDAVIQLSNGSVTLLDVPALPALDQLIA